MVTVHPSWRDGIQPMPRQLSQNAANTRYIGHGQPQQQGVQ